MVPGGEEPGPDQLSLDDFAAAVATELEPALIPKTVKVFGHGSDLEDPAIDRPALVAGPVTAAAVAPGLAGLIANLLRMLSPAINPEVFVRFAANIERHAIGSEAAKRTGRELREAMEAAAKAWEADWPADVPTLDSGKEPGGKGKEEEPDFPVSVVAKVVGRLVGFLAAHVPGGEEPDPKFAFQVGREAHRA